MQGHYRVKVVPRPLHLGVSLVGHELHVLQIGQPGTKGGLAAPSPDPAVPLSLQPHDLFRQNVPPFFKFAAPIPCFFLFSSKSSDYCEITQKKPEKIHFFYHQEVHQKLLR